MDSHGGNPDSPAIATILAHLQRIRPEVPPSLGDPADRCMTDAAALLYHLNKSSDHPPLLAVIGGTGTGKSTLINRLLGADISSASFRRTFTAGPVAITADTGSIPSDWQPLPRVEAQPEDLPTRGRAAVLVVASRSSALTDQVTLIDTPDLDGDQPAHHAQADRIFRWADAIAFLTTPEKYQMTELLPYYRLARRYALPVFFVLNKAEESAVLEDFRRQLASRDWPDARLFAVPRDDAAYEPPAGASLDALRHSLLSLAEIIAVPPAHRQAGLRRRRDDLAGRVQDQLVAPLRQRRREVDRLIAALRSLTTPEPGVDVAPATRQLQRRLQEQSILYLMGPARIFDRLRQLPVLLSRLPRFAWDALARGEPPQMPSPHSVEAEPGARRVPDFPALLADQMTILHSRIGDVLVSGQFELPTDWPHIAAGEAAAIAETELADLKKWLDERWQRSPRDTAVVQRLLKHLPGGAKLVKYTEAAPYLLTIVVTSTGAMFGHIDQIILGSYTLATWLAERLSNEVTARTRQANRNIADRFAALVRQQVDRVTQWLAQRTLPEADLRRLEELLRKLGD